MLLLDRRLPSNPADGFPPAGGCHLPSSFNGCINKMEIKPPRASRVVDLHHGMGRKGITWIGQDRDAGCRGNRFVQQLEPLRYYLSSQSANTGEVAARPAP